MHERLISQREWELQQDVRHLESQLRELLKFIEQKDMEITKLKEILERALKILEITEEIV